MTMIVGLSQSCELGAVENVNFMMPSGEVRNVPIQVLRQASVEEWVTHYQQAYDASQSDALVMLARRMIEFPNTQFYEVSMD